MNPLRDANCLVLGTPLMDASAAPIAASLDEVLATSTRAADLVGQCGEQLARINIRLRRDVQHPANGSGTLAALRSSQGLEETLGHAAEMMAVVNSELAVQIRLRADLDQQLAAIRAQEAAARHLSLHDALTGLPNRALFNDRLGHDLAQAKRHGWDLALMFIDIDSFKQINDSYGHDVGDRVLQTVAQRMRQGARSGDTASRFGGDEFVYLLQEISGDRDVAAFAQKLAAILREPILISQQTRGLSLRIHASIGIAMFPQHGERAETLLRKADAAMYQAKRSSADHVFAC